MPGHPIDPLLFYKLKAAQLEIAVLDAQYQQLRTARLETLQGLLREAGVDPMGLYTLVEDGHRIVAMPGGE